MHQSQITNYFNISVKASIINIRKMKEKRISLSLKNTGQTPQPADVIVLSSDEDDSSHQVPTKTKSDFSELQNGSNKKPQKISNKTKKSRKRCNQATPKTTAGSPKKRCGVRTRSQLAAELEKQSKRKQCLPVQCLNINISTKDNKVTALELNGKTDLRPDNNSNEPPNDSLNSSGDCVLIEREITLVDLIDELDPQECPTIPQKVLTPAVEPNERTDFSEAREATNKKPRKIMSKTKRTRKRSNQSIPETTTRSPKKRCGVRTRSQQAAELERKANINNCLPVESFNTGLPTNESNIIGLESNHKTDASPENHQKELLNESFDSTSDCVLIEKEVPLINLTDELDSQDLSTTPQKTPFIKVISEERLKPPQTNDPIKEEVKPLACIKNNFEEISDFNQSELFNEFANEDLSQFGLNQPDDDTHVKFTMVILDYVFKHTEHQLLFTETHHKLYKTLQKIPKTDLRFCIRLFYRKFGWHRWSNLKKADYCTNLSPNNLNELVNLGLINMKIDSAPIETLLGLLNSKELQTLAKQFKLTIGKKEDLITAFVKHANQKNGVASFFKSSKSVYNIVSKDVLKLLGPCLCISEDCKTIFGRAQLLFAINDYETRQELYRKMFDNMLRPVCLGFELDMPKLFPSESFFTEYESCRFLCEDMINATEKKDNIKAFEIVLKAYRIFTQVIIGEEYQKQIEELPSPFLKRFSPGHSLCVILSTGITVLKQESKKKSGLYSDSCKQILNECFQSQSLETEHLLQILDILLDTGNIWKLNRKVEWLHEKLMLLRQKKDFEQVQSVLINAFKSESYTKSELFTLNLCAEKYLLPKKLELKPELAELFTKYEKFYKFPEEYIYADKIDVSVNGTRKSTFQSTDENGDVSYLNVEQVAISHYKRNENFEEGVHCEGTPIYALFTILFWDLIYEFHVPNTFISPIQTLPLDLYSRQFYENRKAEIDARLNEMEGWSEEEFVDAIQFVFDNKAVSASVYDFEKYDSGFLGMICKCMRKRNIIGGICKKLAQEYGVYYAGFPDLILWSMSTRKIKFVEVKGPGDKLRPKQKLWLHFLQDIEANVEVCYVKDKSSKSLSPIKTPKKDVTLNVTPKNSPYKTPQSSPRKTPNSSPRSNKPKVMQSPKRKAVKRLNML